MDHRLPIHQCQSVYCTSLAGYWHGRIICIGEPKDSIVGWCNVCEKYVCSRCALLKELSEKQWHDLSNQESEYELHQNYDLIPLILHCKRCGSVLQKGKTEKILILELFPIKFAPE